MSRQRRIVLAVSAALVLTLAIITTLLVRERVRRQRVLRPGATPATAKIAGIPPVEQWTAAFEQLPAKDLVALLGQIEKQHADLYAKWSLGYLHALALIEADEEDSAVQKLAPFLAADHRFRALALYHRASIADGEEASRFRRMLIDE